MTRPGDTLRNLTLVLLGAHGLWVVQLVFGVVQADVATDAQWWRRTWLIVGTVAGLLLLTLPAGVLYLQQERPWLAFTLSALPAAALPVLLVHVLMTAP